MFSPIRSSLLVAQNVAAAVKKRLSMSPYPSLRSVCCEYVDGVLFLRGTVSSFYEKQLAQEAVSRLDGVDSVTNEISVACGQDSRDRTAKSRYAFQCSDPAEQRASLKEAAEAGYVPAMCDYGLSCEDQDERRRWLREAAHEGYVPAAYHYALECSGAERKRWLRQAAQSGSPDAMFAYARECEDPVEAASWLRKTACEGHAPAMYELAMGSDDLRERKQWLARAADQGWEAAIEALDALE